MLRGLYNVFKGRRSAKSEWRGSIIASVKDKQKSTIVWEPPQESQ